MVAFNKVLGRTVVYAGSEGGWFTAFDEATGRTIWSVNVGTAVRSTPVVDGSSAWVVDTYQSTTTQTQRRNRHPAVLYESDLRPW